MPQLKFNGRRHKDLQSSNNEYKNRLISSWNELAIRYHKKWVTQKTGPFQITSKLVELANLNKPCKILDIACGTGAVINEISQKTNYTHHHNVIGIDLSYNAIKIAKKWTENRSNIDFIVADAENFHINEKFDVITCQFALFFFPAAYRVLQNIKQLLKKNGKLCIAVHGKNVPYFNCILEVVTKFIPDYIPKGSPNLDRFASKLALRKAVKKSGFTNIKIYEYEFKYSPGDFSKYWSDYFKYISTPLKEKLSKLPLSQKNSMKAQIRERTLPYTKNNKIIFPWQVLILTAKNPKV